MFLRYGNYTHPLGEPAVTISKETVYTEAMQPYAIRERWEITGRVINSGGSPATMVGKLRALETAYAVDGKDARIVLPNGASTTHALLNRSAIGGVRVIRRPSYPQGNGAEHVTFRTFSVALEAMVAIETLGAILAFEEIISFSGGGPRYGHIETLTGPPIKQLLRRQSVFRASQRGQAVGLYRYPAIPAALWPAAIVKAPDISYRSPRRRGAGYFEYEVSWACEFESAGSLFGSPHRWTFA